jgi:hypothetical protein
MKSALLTFFILSLFLIEVSAQEKISENRWGFTKPTINIPDSLNKYDAIMIHSQYDLDNNLPATSIKFKFNEKYLYRIKINTLKGLEKNTTFKLLVYHKKALIKLDARIIKPSGTIIDLSLKDISIKDSINKKSNETYYYKLVKIPKVEIGDEFEFTYTLEANSIFRGKDVILHNSIPTLKSVFTYTAKSILITHLHLYNKMPEPIADKDWSQSTLTWTLTNLPGIGEVHKTDFKDTIPFIRFAVRRIVDADGLPLQYAENYGIISNGWPNIYRNLTKSINNKYYCCDDAGDTLYRKFPSLLTINKNLPVENKINYFIQFIRDSIYVNDSISFSENHSNLKISKKYSLNYLNLISLTNQFFKDQNIKYYWAFGKSKYNGKIDMNFSSFNELDAIFYLIEDEKGAMHTFVPTNLNYAYLNLDEIPYWLGGTDAIIVKELENNEQNRPLINAGQMDVLMVKIPANEQNANIRNFISNVQINLDGVQDDKIKSKINYTGYFSFFERQFLLNSLQENNFSVALKESLELRDNFKVDSFWINRIDSSFPFDFNFSLDGKLNIAKEKYSDKTVSFSLEGMINHYTIETDDEERTLNVIFPFKYTDVNKIYIQFNKPIELITNDLENYWIQDSFGSYKVSITKINDQVLLLESKIELKKDKISAMEFKKLHQINENIKKLNKSYLTIRAL